MDPLLNLLSKNAIGLCITDEKGNCIDANQEFCRIFDSEINSLIGIPFYKLVSENQTKSFKKLFDKLFSSSVHTIEYEYKKSEATNQVLSFASEWRNDSGLLQLYISVRKIQYPKQMQLQLQDKEEEQRADFFALTNNMPDIFYSFDTNMKLINFNVSFVKTCAQYFRTVPQVGDSVIGLVSHTDQNDLFNVISKSASGSHFSFEDKLSHAGVDTFFDVSINPIIKENGQQIGVSVFAKNITKRKELENESREKELLLNTMFHSMTEGVALVNQLGELIICNEGLNNLIGISDNSAMIADWQNLYRLYDPISKIQIPFEEHPLKQALKGIRITSKEYMIKNQQKGELYVVCSAIPILDHNAVVIAGMTVQHNISAIKNASKELLESHERFEYVTKATFDAIWDLNLVTDDLYWGEGFDRLFGYSVKANKGDIVVWYEHIHEEDRPRILNSINTLIKGRETNWTEEYRFMKANGEMAFVRNKGIVLRDANGKGVRMIGAMQDITVQKKEEQQLRLFKSVITNISEIVLITEAEPIEKPGPRIVYVNDAFSKFTGYSLEEIVGKTPRILQGELTNRQDLDRIKVALKNWEPCELEIVNYKKNGEAYWASMSIAPMANEKGYFTHWISIQRIITERKKEGIEKEFFYDLIQTINGNDFLELSLSIAIEKISNYFGYTYAEAWLVNIDDTKMLYKANWAKNEKAARFRLKPPLEYSLRGIGVMGKSWEDKRILYYDDLQKSEFLCKDEAKLAGLTSVLLVPIFYNDRVIAMFNFFSDKPFNFEQISSDLINKISKQIGSDIQKSRTDDELNRFFNLSPDLLCIIGFDGYFKKINQAVSNLLGYSEAEMLKRDIASFYNPELEEKFLGGKEKFEEGQSLVNYENRIITKSGDMKWLSWTAVPINEEDVIFAVAKDITEKKQLELERENILESISDCFYALDNDFNFTYINAPAQILLRKSNEDLIGKNIFETYPFFKEGLFYEKFQQVLFEKEPTHFEIQFHDSSNWYEESFYPTADGISIFFRSINERKRIEKEINDAYAEKNTILESITDGFFTFDRNYRVTYINKSAEKQLKITWNRFVGKILWDVVAGEAAPVSKIEYARALRDNTAVHFEEFYSPINTLFEISAYPSELGLSVYFKDITEAKRQNALELLEKEVLEKNANPDAELSEIISFYLSEIEKLHPGMTCSVLKLQDGKVYNWAGPNINKNFAAAINGLAIGPEEGSCGTAAFLKQQVIVSDISTDKRWVKYKELASESGYNACWSYPIINTLGTVLGTFAIYYKDTKLPSALEENTISRTLNILRVIIENKEFESEILEMNERYNLVTKATNDIIWDWNINTDEVYRTGDGVYTLLDNDQNSTISTNAYWQSRIHPDDLEITKQKMKEFLADPNMVYWSANYRFRKPDDTYAYFFEKGYLTRNQKKEAVRMIGAARDITHQKETELILNELNEKLKIRAEELADSNIELERFAYVASHDLQEPLRMVSSFLQLLQKKYEPQLDDTANKYINLAVDGSNRMKRLISDLLQFSRVTSTVIALKPVDINEIMQELTELFKAKILACNGTLVIENMPIVNADKTQMTQLLQNLISNALKYRGERDPIIKVNAKETEKEWVFLIEDNGIGIDPKFFEKIFVIFQRLHNKDEYSGTGIGLAICKKIVERFNGKIWVESEPGKGSKFYFSIPK